MSARRRNRSLFRDALFGAIAGALASWLMEEAERPLMNAGSKETREREKVARGDMPPATIRAAEAAARAVGRELPDAQKKVGGEAVHYAVGAAWGALFGALAPRLVAPGLAAGAAYGVAVWLLNDELLIPALGWSRTAREYPVSVHAKALAAHLVYGTATGVGFRALERVLH